jgi:hypothetical protein
VTTGRSRRFITPVGLFIYHRISPAAFPVGVDRVQIEGGRAFLMAVPEKALADKIQDDRGTGIRTQDDMRKYLTQNLRIDVESLEKLKANTLAVLAEQYGSRKLQLLHKVVARLQKSGGSHE